MTARLRQAGRRRGIVLMSFLLAFVGCNAAFMGGATVSSEVDGANRIIALGLFIVLALATLMFSMGLFHAVFSARFVNKRWREINRGLYARGFRDASGEEVRETLSFPVQLLAPYTLALHRGGGVDHVTV